MVGRDVPGAPRTRKRPRGRQQDARAAEDVGPYHRSVRIDARGRDAACCVRTRRAGARALSAAVERAARGRRREREARPQREARERHARTHEGAADGRRVHAGIIAQRDGRGPVREVPAHPRTEGGAEGFWK